MMKLKKTFGAIVAVMMAVSVMASLTACDPDPEGPPEPPSVTVSKIEVIKEPVKMDYIVGETFDPTGMEVRATYSDKTTNTVDNADLKFDPAGELAKDDTEIKITYQNRICYLDGIVVQEAAVHGGTFRFEAEEAEQLDGTDKGYNCAYVREAEGASQGYAMDVRKDHKGGATIDGGAWADITLGDADEGVESNVVGLKISFTSSEDAEATFAVRFSLRTKMDNQSPYGKNILKLGNKVYDRFTLYRKTFSVESDGNAPEYKTFLNGEVIEIDELIHPYATYDKNKADADREWEWHIVQFNTNIKEGANEFVMAINGTGNAGAIDYIDITTPADIENTTTPVKHNVAEGAEYSMLVEPTYNEIGWLGQHCDICGAVVATEKIPALTAENLTATTTAATSTNDGVGTYTLNLHGTDYVLDNKAIPATGKHYTYVFEGEDAELYGKNNQDGGRYDCNSNDGVFGHPGLSAVTAGYSRASGHTYLRTYFYVKGNTITYKIKSEKAVTVKFTMGIGKPVDPENANTVDTEKLDPISLNGVWEAKLNDAKIFSDDLTVGIGYGYQSSWAATNCDWVQFSADVSLKAGDNTIVITATSEQYRSNFDYISFTGADNVITNESVANMHQPGWVVEIVPDETTKGLAVYYPLCHICNFFTRGNIPVEETLPALTDSAYVVTDGTDEEGNAVKVYTYTFKDGGTVSFNVAVETETEPAE